MFWWAIDSQEKYSLPFIDPILQREVTPYLLNASIFLLVIGTPVVAVVNFALVMLKRRASNCHASESLNYFAKHPEAQEIDSIVEFGKNLVDENHIDAETLKRRFSINPKIITCLYDSESTIKLIGYFIIYPLTKTAHDKILKGLIRNGREIRDEHICKYFDKASALYIGMVGGVGLHAEGYALNELLETLRVLIRNKKLKTLFTRGATEDGKRAASIFGFQKMPAPSEISVLFNNQELHNHSRIRRHLNSTQIESRHVNHEFHKRY